MFGLIRGRFLRRPVRWLLLALFMSLFSPVAPIVASADQFSSPAGPPVLGQISITENESDPFSAFQPADSHSVDFYKVNVNVSNAGGIESLDTQRGVVICLWLETTDDCVDTSGDTNPEPNMSPNPQTTFIMTWAYDTANATDVFEIVDSANNYYRDAGSSSDYDDNSPSNSAVVSFRFHVSNAMRHSFDWNLSVTADNGSTSDVDGDGMSDGKDVALIENVRSNYYAGVTTQRPAKSFSVSEGGSAQLTGPLGDYKANAHSQVTITADTYFQSASGAQLDIRASNPQRKVSLECYPGSSSGSAMIIDDRVQDFTTVGLIPEESSTAIGMHTCTLEYLDIIEEVDTFYSNTVTVAIGVAEANAPQSLSITDGTTGVLDDGTVRPELTWQAPAVTTNGQGATVISYTVDVATDTSLAIDDTNKNWQFLTETSSTSFIASVTEQSDFDFRVTANTTVGAGTAFITAQTSTGASLTSLQNINAAVSGFTETTLPSSVVSAIENEGYTVFASPTYGSMAERMPSVYGTISQKGVFRRDVFSQGLDVLNNSFGNGITNKPFIGFAAFADEKFLGTAIMGFTEINGTATDGDELLRDLFTGNNTIKKFKTYVLNANGTAVNEATSSSNTSQTVWSDGFYPSSLGYLQSNRFASDDFIWGFRSGFTGRLDGNGGFYLRQNSATAYGIENDNGTDYQTQYFWGNQSGYDNNHVYYFFTLLDQ